MIPPEVVKDPNTSLSVPYSVEKPRSVFSSIGPKNTKFRLEKMLQKGQPMDVKSNDSTIESNYEKLYHKMVLTPLSLKKERTYLSKKDKNLNSLKISINLSIPDLDWEYIKG